LCDRYPCHLHINLAERYRNRGIGSALIAAFAAQAANAGRSGIHVVTGERARNVRFYEKNEFCPLATARWNGADSVFMGRLLRPRWRSVISEQFRDRKQLSGGLIERILEGLMVCRGFSWNLEGDWLRRKRETIKLAVWPLPMKSPQKARKCEMSKQAMRDEAERLVKEALERKNLTVKQGKTRIDSRCRKCGALNRVSATQGQVRVPYTCKECGEKQRTFWQRSTRGGLPLIASVGLTLIYRPQLNNLE
jgi:hypothetical protein